MPTPIANDWTTWAARHPAPTLFLAILFTGLAFAGLARVDAEVDFVATVPHGEEVEAYRHMLQRLDGVRFVAIYMANDPSGGHRDLRTDAGFDALVREQQNLTRLLETRFPGTFSHSLSAYEAMRAGHYMFHKLATGGNPPPSSYSLPQDRVTWDAVRRQVRDGGNVDEVLARDGSSALALFFLATKDPFEARVLAGQIEDVALEWSHHHPSQHPATHQHAATGLLASSHYVDERNQRELRVWGAVSALAVALVLWVAFRRPSDVLIAIASLACALVWTFGIMGWSGIRISFLTVFLAPLVMGVGIDYAIHILQRFSEERRRGRTKQAALVHAVQETGIAVRLAAVTTMLGLSLLLLVPAPLFAEIGGVAALGIAMSVVCALTLTPALRGLWPDKPGRPSPPSKRSLPLRLGLLASRRRRTVRALVAGSTLLFLLVALLFNHVESGSAENEFPADDPVLQLRQRVEREYGSFQNAYLIVEGDATQPAVLRALYDASRAANAIRLHHSSASVADLLIAHASTDQGLVDVLHGQARPSEPEQRLPQTRQEAKSSLDALFRDPLWRSLAPFTITREYDLAVVAIELRPTEDAGELVALRNQLHGIRDRMRETLGPDYRVSAAGAPINRASVIEQTPLDVGLSIVGVAGATFLVLFTVWGHRHGGSGRRMAFVASGVVLGAAILLLGTVPLMDAAYDGLQAAGLGAANNAALNNMFLLAFALTVAVGIDNTVYLTTRFWRERATGALPEQALERSLRHAGASITITTATTFVAFALLAGTYFLQSKNLAVLTALGALYSYALCLLLVPGFLVRPRGTSGATW